MFSLWEMRFSFSYKPRSVGGSQWNELVWQEGGDTMVLRNLRQHTEYVVQMTPYNKAGHGPMTEATAITYEGSKAL